MELTKEKICQLIDLYHERPILWDQTQSNYKNKYEKNDAWSEISDIMGIDKGEIEKKMKNLIGQFYRECKRTKSGAGTDDVIVSKWFAFQSLMFLKDKNKPRPTTEAGIEENCQVMNEMYTEEECVSLEVNNEKNNCMTNNMNAIRESTTDSTAQISDELFITPKLPTKKNKKRKDNPMAEEAYEVMKSLVNKQGQRDEFHVFGEHVANKIRKLSTDYAKSTAEYLINNILYEAETGKYNFPPQLQYGNSQQPYYQNQSGSVVFQSQNQSSSIPSSPASSTITSLASSATSITPALSFIEEDSFDEVLHSI